jgi:hypothetical protein
VRFKELFDSPDAAIQLLGADRENTGARERACQTASDFACPEPELFGGSACGAHAVLSVTTARLLLAKSHISNAFEIGG